MTPPKKMTQTERVERYCQSRWGITTETANMIRLVCMNHAGYLYNNRYPTTPKRSSLLKEAGILADRELYISFLDIADLQGLKWPEDEDGS